MSRARHAGCGLAFLCAVTASFAAESSLVGGARLEPVGFDDLPGWAVDDHGAAYGAFLRTCAAIAEHRVALRTAQPASEALLEVCRTAQDRGPGLSAAAARSFFERHFVPMAIFPPTGRGFLTGYYEPEFEGSRQARPPFLTPLLALPHDHVTAPPGGSLPGLDPSLQAARRGPSGLQPYPERAAIESGALGDAGEPIAHVREPGEAFIIQVQGSARLRLQDGSLLRLAYAGRNGHPYTSIGRLLIERGEIEPGEMSLERLMAWLRDNPVEAREVMHRNRSYVFFRVADELDPSQGPIGGAGVPLTPGRSLAVDRTLWSYGLPFWLEGELPRASGESEPLRRLMIAQDTGSAIVGPARGDFFFGSGSAAGTRAGLLRHETRFFVLRPRPRP